MCPPAERSRILWRLLFEQRQTLPQHSSSSPSLQELCLKRNTYQQVTPTPSYLKPRNHQFLRCLTA